MEEVKDGMNTVMWDGPGTYVAKRLRGPTTFHKLPDGKQPEHGVIVREYASKPIQEEEPVSNGLWR